MTGSGEGPAELIVLDACCLINLLATGQAAEILGALPYRFAVARYVAEEEVLEVGTDPPRLAPLLAEGIVERLDLSSTDEERQLVRFAVDLDDGEAHTCALAIVRRARVATDDRKAIRVLRSAWDGSERRGGVAHPAIRTSELLFEWSELAEPGERALAGVVSAIARRASFLPPRSDPFFERWMALVRTDGS